MIYFAQFLILLGIIALFVIAGWLLERINLIDEMFSIIIIPGILIILVLWLLAGEILKLIY